MTATFASGRFYTIGLSLKKIKGLGSTNLFSHIMLVRIAFPHHSFRREEIFTGQLRLGQGILKL